MRTASFTLVCLFASIIGFSPTLLAQEEVTVTKAIRAVSTPKIDGKLDDLVWKQAIWYDKMVQRQPVFGQSPSAPTSFAVAFDSDYFYFAIRCGITDETPIVSRLTRRDRFGDFDLVSLTLAPRFDGRTGYAFQVNPNGVQLDMAFSDDGQQDPSWDAVWQAETTVTDEAWTVEMAIPLDQIRFTPGNKRWGIQVTRWMSSLQESVMFRPVHPEKNGWISNVGVLEGVEEISPKLPLTITPEAYFSYRTSTAGYGGRGDDGFSYGIGGYAKAGVAPDWVMDMAFNPDFGQVEVDDVVLNLTAYETQFPEKRPFFLESAGLFKTPMDLFYSRRLGAAPPSPTLGDTETTIGGPAGTPIVSAVKLTGRNSNGLSLGLLNAVLLPTEFTVTDSDSGTSELRQSTPWTNAAVLRLTLEPAQNVTLGVLGTALNPDNSKGSYTAGGDWSIHSCDRKYVLRGQAAGSFRQDDVLGKDVSNGGGIWTQVAREGGETFRAWADYSYYSPEFDLNDLGYLRRADLHSYSARLELRRVRPWGPLLEMYTALQPRGEFNTSGLDLGQVLSLDTALKWKSNWWSGGGVYGKLASYDDMETRGGPALPLPRKVGWFAWVGSPEHTVVGFDIGASTATRPYGYGLNTWMSFILRLDRLELRLSPEFLRWQGDLAYVDTVSSDRTDEDVTVVGRRDLDQLNVSLKGTFVITRNLTFQAQAQLLTASAEHSRFRELLSDSSMEEPYSYSADDADFSSTDLNLQALLRWEYLPGSTLYAVYTHTGFVGTYGSNPMFLEHIRFLKDEERQQLFMLKLSHMFG